MNQTEIKTVFAVGQNVYGYGKTIKEAITHAKKAKSKSQKLPNRFQVYLSTEDNIGIDDFGYVTWDSGATVKRAILDDKETILQDWEKVSS